jgi:hypothetical protein
VLLLWPGHNNNNDNDKHHRKPHRAAEPRATTCGTTTMIGVAVVVFVFDSVVVDFICFGFGGVSMILHNKQKKGFMMIRQTAIGQRKP